MAKSKPSKKKPTDVTVECSCGAKARVFELDKGFMAHCPGCGSLTFFHNPELLERLRFGGQLCPHHVEAKPCPGGYTAWCPVCRVRTFYRDSKDA